MLLTGEEKAKDILTGHGQKAGCGGHGSVQKQASWFVLLCVYPVMRYSAEKYRTCLFLASETNGKQK